MNTNHCGQDGIEELRNFIAERDKVIARLGAKVTELRAQRNTLEDALKQYMAAYNENWTPGMPIMEPIGDAAIAAARNPAGSPAGEGGE